MTPQRRAVIEMLVGNTDHPTPESVAKYVQASMPGVSLSTIYNILSELANLGLLQRVDTVAGMRFDPETGEHAHLCCTQCDAVVDIALAATDFDLLRKAGTKKGAYPEKVSIEYRGLCPACASSVSSSAAGKA